MKSNNQIKVFSHKCANCGASLNIERNMESITCDFCGYTSLIAPSELEQLQNSQNAKSQSRASSIIMIVVLIPVIIAFFIGICVAFGMGYKSSGIVALLQCMGIIAALCLGLSRKKSAKRTVLVTVLILVSFGMAIPYFGLMGNVDEQREDNKRKQETYDEMTSLDVSWPATELGRVVPKPDIEMAVIWDNTGDEFNMYTPDVRQEFIDDYIQQCIDSGFTENVQEHINGYEAYTSDGYYVNTFLTDENEFHLTAKAPLTLKKYYWPQTGAGSLIPEPKNEYGEIVVNDKESFLASVYNVSEDDFEKYKKACKDAGFDKDIVEYGTSFTASDKDGNSVDLFLFSDYYRKLSVSVKAKS